MQTSIEDTFGYWLNRFGYNELWQTMTGNKRPYLLFMQRFLNIFLNRFELRGLPDETKRVTCYNNNQERFLFFAPAVSIFRDDALGVQVLPVASWESKRDIAGFPLEWTVTAGNGYKKRLNRDNAVLMYNDMGFTVPFIHLLYEMSFMVEIDNTHKQNLFALRQPLLAEITEDEKKSALKFIDKLKEFEDVIKVRVRETERGMKDRAAPYDMKVFNTGAQILGDELNKDFVNFENRALTYLGINNVTFEKKERMLTGELSQNDQLVQSNFTNALMCRKNAWDVANKMFGTSVEVVPAEYLAPTTQQVNTQSQNYQGGDNNERFSANGSVQNADNVIDR